MTLIQHLRTGPSRWTRRQFFCVVLALLALSIWTAVRWHTQALVAASGESAPNLELASQTQPLSGEGATVPTVRVGSDFTATLPSPVNEAPFLAALEEVLISKGLLIQGLSVAKTPPTVQSLEQVSLQVSLSGAYMATVELVEELLGQFPGSTVQSMQFTRQDAGGVDTALVFNLWGRALPSESAAQLLMPRQEFSVAAGRSSGPSSALPR
jgi:hypothetical protein